MKDNDNDLTIDSCARCFVRFAYPKEMETRRRNDGKSFYCPNGHSLVFNNGESQEDILRRERDRLAQDAARLSEEAATAWRARDAAEQLTANAQASERKAKKNLVSLKKRTAAGICPCCNRSFLELSRHIATKHPTFRAEDVTHENVVSLVKSRA